MLKICVRRPCWHLAWLAAVALGMPAANASTPSGENRAVRGPRNCGCTGCYLGRANGRLEAE